MGTLTKHVRDAIPPRSRRAVLLAILLFGSIGSYLGISRFLLGTVQVEGASMAPVLAEGERLLLHRWYFLFRDPARGDIVGIRDPTDGTRAVKRIVALPGDELFFSQGLVFINGDALAETYLGEGAAEATAPGIEARLAMADDMYFVMGDNRKNSLDSRAYGTLRRRDILGLILP